MLITIIQIFILALFVMAGMMKIAVPKPTFQKKMAWAKEYSQNELRFIGMAEILGGVGITLPIWLDIIPWISPIAAIGLMMVTLLAARLHSRRKETGSVFFALFVFLLVLYVFTQTVGLLGL